jgi:hypothetical protein
MPKNWDPIQVINHNTGRVEWPQGPLTNDEGKTFQELGWTPKWVEAWVVQDGTGASQATRQVPNGGWAPGRWSTVGIPPGWIDGRFQPGVALGIALVAYNNGTADVFDWWTTPVLLIEEGF